MKKFFLSGLLITITSFLLAQKADVINLNEVERIEEILSADSMQGRKVFSEGINKAANFIAKEFKAAGLQKINGSKSFLQKFTMLQAEQISFEAIVNGNPVDSGNILVVTSQQQLTVNEKKGFSIVRIKNGENLTESAKTYIAKNKNLLVLVDTSFASKFYKLFSLKKNVFKSPGSVIFLLTSTDPLTYSIKITNLIKESELANVVGILPGKSRKNEYVVFSGHYDHLGVGKPNDQLDSIFNGANDDAAGTTSVIMLAKYFAKLKNNERTLVFTAFTAEETGGYGSRYFSQQFNPSKVMAMFNIEMIGTESKWGANSAYITGYEKTDMGEILEKNLTGTGFTFYPDPYPRQHLFYRSDNATLARQGVPAHTISTSKMDSEKFYHTQEDELETLDMKNMTEIIKAIALSSRSIISGKATPSRVNTDELER